MFMIAVVGLMALLVTSASGCNGCGQVVAVEGGACEQQTDCAEGLWCLGRVCQHAPAVHEAPDAGRDAATLDSGGADTGADVSCIPICQGKCAGPDGCNGTCPNICVAPQICGGSGTLNVCGTITVSCSTSPTGRGGEMCLVPAGPFWMGCNSAVDKECSDAEKPYHEVTVPAFSIDKYEVTASEYQTCVNAGGCSGAATSPIECNYSAPEKENHPINCVDWYQAKAYCTWAGKRLPAEAEWEKAARGTDGRKHPWGNDPLDCNRAVHSVSPCSNSRTAEVGSKPTGVSPYGAMDMVGNVWERIEDEWHDSYTEAPANGSAWIDTPRGVHRVSRGGSWYSDSRSYYRASARNQNNSTGWYFNTGFRCAYSNIADLDGGIDEGPDSGLDAGQDAEQDAGDDAGDFGVTDAGEPDADLSDGGTGSTDAGGGDDTGVNDGGTQDAGSGEWPPSTPWFSGTACRLPACNSDAAETINITGTWSQEFTTDSHTCDTRLEQVDVRLKPGNVWTSDVVFVQQGECLYGDVAGGTVTGVIKGRTAITCHVEPPVSGVTIVETGWSTFDGATAAGETVDHLTGAPLPPAECEVNFAAKLIKK